MRWIVTTVHADPRPTYLLVVHLLGVEDVPGERGGHVLSGELGVNGICHDQYNPSRDLERLCMSLPMRRTHT